MSAFLPFDVALLARSPLVDPWRLRLAACIAAGLLALAIAFVMIRMIWRIHWRGQTARHYVHLRNRGNLMSVLALGAYAPAHNLQFRYLLDGETLAVRKTVPAAAPAPAPGPGAAAPGPAQAEQAPAAALPAAPQPSQPAKTAGQQAAQAAASAQEKVEKVAGISSLLIDIVGTLGSLLPGALGQSLKDRSVQLQAKKSAIKARGQAPMRAVKQAQHLKDSVGDLKDEVGPAGQAAAPASATPAARQTAPLPSTAAQAPAPQAAALPALQAAAPSLPCPEYVQLPALAPEASLRLEMRVSPANPYYKGESCYWLFTLPQGDPSRLPPEALEAQKEVKEVTFGGLSIYYWLLTLLLSAAAVLVNGAWYYFFVRWIAYTFA